MSDRVRREEAWALCLGELDDAERERLEALMFEEDAAHEAIRTHEDALIEAYLDDDLESSRRERFELRYASGSAYRRVELMKELRRIARDEARAAARRAASVGASRSSDAVEGGWVSKSGFEAPVAAEPVDVAAARAPSRSGERSAVHRRPRSSRWARRFGALGAVGIAAAAMWMLIPTPAPVDVRLSLQPELVRSAPAGSSLQLPLNPEGALWLELAFGDAPVPAKPEVILLSEGREVYRGVPERVDAWAAEARVPLSALAPGAYRVLLREEASSSGSAIEYRLQLRSSS